MANVFDSIQVPVYTAPAQKSVESQPVSIPVKEALPATDVKADTVVISEKKKKNGPIKGLKGFVSGIKKLFASTSAYMKGIFKGIGAAAVGGSIVYTSSNFINFIRAKCAKKADKVIKKIPSKTLGVLVAVGAMSINLWQASLNSTQKKSEIDLRYTGLNNK